ncbi:fimbrial biogenesis outer membrane usher protein [Serratia sp. S1B]|nr:fimbrial biogenesis outer membrane usher protein [Serratia sp. S1B]
MEYNAEFIHGTAVDVSQFSEGNPVVPGIYSLNVLVNGEPRGRRDVQFVAIEGKENAEAAFTADDFKQLGIKFDKSQNLIEGASYRLSELIPQSNSIYNSGDLELALNVPQANQEFFPRGYIDPSLWEHGNKAAFLDYNANYYSLSSGGSNSERRSEDHSSNIGLLSGVNVAGWRLRQRSNITWMKGDDKPHTKGLATYAATDITALKSQLTLGDTNTSGKLYDSFVLRGVQLRSDDRMLPEGVRSYSPIVSGVAQTNARVTIMQHGMKVYEAVVPPGPFEFSDIGAMGYGGDLQMIITESNGTVRTSNIPFSAPPMLLHKGVSSFELATGEMNDDTLKDKPKVLQGLLQYGLGNNYTLYGGSQIGDHYYAMSLGNAINTQLGGFAVDITRAWADIDRRSVGNSYNISYSKFMQETATNLTMSAYRYSSKDFYSLRDASITLGGRTNDSYDVDYRTKERFTLAVSQRLWDTSSLNFIGSFYSYWSGESKSKQYSVTWSKPLRYFSFALTAMRTSDQNNNYENTYMASINVPIGGGFNKKPLFNSLYSTYSHSTPKSDRFQMNINGSQGEQNELSYGVGTSVQKNRDSDSLESLSGNMSYRSAYGQFGVTAGVESSGGSRQFSSSAMGSVVAHKGGITFGPSVGDMPFAIIGAPGADGAKVYNGQGAKIDGRGYAVMPSLSAYRENTVGLDYKSLPNSVDVMGSNKTIVPREGAIIAIDMKTIEGTPLVLIIRDKQGQFLPVGSELVDDKGGYQGISGQGGMAFVRGWDPASSTLYAIYSKNKCRIEPARDTQNQVQASTTNNVVQMEVTCYSN